MEIIVNGIKYMVKSQLIEHLAARNSITVSQSERYLNSLINLIYETVRNKGQVMISGFGTFSGSHREPRIGVNPRKPTERIQIPELITPKFKAGEAFKDAIKLRK